MCAQPPLSSNHRRFLPSKTKNENHNTASKLSIEHSAEYGLYLPASPSEDAEWLQLSSKISCYSPERLAELEFRQRPWPISVLWTDNNQKLSVEADPNITSEELIADLFSKGSSSQENPSSFVLVIVHPEGNIELEDAIPLCNSPLANPHVCAYSPSLSLLLQ